MSAADLLLAGMAYQRGRLLEVVAALQAGDMTDAHARSYLALVQDNLAILRKAADRPDGPAAELGPLTHLAASMEHSRNRLLDLLAALKRGDLTEHDTRDYLELVGKNLAAIQKTARTLR